MREKEDFIRAEWLEALKIIEKAPIKERVIMIEMHPKTKNVFFNMVKLAHNRGCTIVIPRKDMPIKKQFQANQAKESKYE